MSYIFCPKKVIIYKVKKDEAVSIVEKLDGPEDKVSNGRSHETVSNQIQ